MTKIEFLKRQTGLTGFFKGSKMPEKTIENKMEFENTPLFKASLKAEVEAKQGNLFKEVK